MFTRVEKKNTCGSDGRFFCCSPLCPAPIQPPCLDVSALVKGASTVLKATALNQELQGGPTGGFQSYLPLTSTEAAALLWETLVRDDVLLNGP